MENEGRGELVIRYAKRRRWRGVTLGPPVFMEQRPRHSAVRHNDSLRFSVDIRGLAIRAGLFRGSA